MQNTEQELQTKLEKLESQVQKIEREGRTRKWFHWPSTIIGVLLATVMLAVLGYANTPSSVSRTDFTSGTVISASTMNSQFNSIYTVMNDLLSLIQIKSGKVGINNAAPAYTLDVTGNAHVSGTFSATYFPSGRNENIFIRPHTSNPTYQISINADYLTLYGSSNIVHIASSVSTTVDITVSGIGGLDSGSESPDTWYYVWAVSDGTTVSGLLSTSATSPTLPGGATYKKLVSAVRNDNANNFIYFYQQGNLYWKTPINIDGAGPGYGISNSGASSATNQVITEMPVAFGGKALAKKLFLDFYGTVSNTINIGPNSSLPVEIAILNAAGSFRYSVETLLDATGSFYLSLSAGFNVKPYACELNFF
ncbi:MAG: hypothetical protein HQM11_18470 [SAR324 cluster bacterium]|nr:hypothetical protein [SAR324 cluster bacterium]